MDIKVHELFELESDSQDNVVLVDFDTVLFIELSVIAEEAFRVTKWDGVVEFSALNFDWIVRRWQQFGVDQVINDLIYEPPRATVWDEPVIVKSFFTAGFYKIWTGQVPGIPEWSFYTKALKYNISA